MKNIVRITALSFLGLLAGSSFNSLMASSETVLEKETDRFSEALVVALQNDNEGVRMSALQQVINYRDEVDVSDAIFEIVSMYRSNENENVRILALSAIVSTQNEWAMDFLKRSAEFENSERVERMTRAALRS